MFIERKGIFHSVDAEEKEQDTVQNPRQEIISASDIERYCYCPLSWWLGRHGVDAAGEAVNQGQKTHDKIGAELEKIKTKETEAKSFERLLIWFAVMASILALIGVTFVTDVESLLFKTVVDVIAIVWLMAALFYLYIGEKFTLVGWKIKMEAFVVVSGMVITIIAILSIPLVIIVDKKVGLIFEILALVWLIGATVVLYFALKRHETVDTKKAQQHIKGEVKYVDDSEAKQRSEVLMSELHNLSGRPDYILKINNKFIPVEIKTGRVPKGPLFSHIIQLACYMLIIENNFGTPPYGILRYGDREHKIDYTEDLRNTLLDKIAEMRTSLRTNEAHRNHRRPGKCRSCSRRDKCPERLV
jgi:CRISPR-associated exonuclease Cas4